jgi:hypothetical protein
MIMQKAFTVTQGAPDTAAETTIPTLIQPGITYGAWELKGIEVTVKPDVMKVWAAVDSDFTLQFTKRSLSGAITRLVTYTDTDLIVTWNLAMNAAGTVANLSFIEASRYLVLPPGIIVYSENMYAQAISTATGSTNVVWGRILYEPITLTPAQAMAVIASRP